MTKSRFSHRLVPFVLVGAAVAPATSAFAQTDAASDQKQGAAATGPTLERDRTSIGGPPLTDASPRLPRVDYGSEDITVPRAASGETLRGETVLGRSRPDYDPVGLDAGSFRIFPEVAVRAGYDSNVFNQQNGRGAGFAHLRGAVRAQSLWGRNEAEFDGFVDQRIYSQYSAEDGLSYNAHAAGRLDVTLHASINAGVQRGRVFVERGATTEILATREPVRYDLTSANIGAHNQFGRFLLDVNGIVSRYQYDDAQTPDGAFLSERYRDSNQYHGQVELGYATGAGPELFVSFAADARRYSDKSVLDRDSTGFELLAGVRSDITPLLRGRVGVGYLRYNFSDPTIATRDGYALDARLDYLITPLTTISLTGRRELRNVSSISRPAALTTTFSIGVDHELLRNLILTGSVNYERSSYVSSPLRVGRYGADVGGFFLLNRLLRLDANLSYRRRDQQGEPIGRDFSEAIGTVGVTAHF